MTSLKQQDTKAQTSSLPLAIPAAVQSRDDLLSSTPGDHGDDCSLREDQFMTTGHAEEEDESKQQIQALLEALNILSKLACMDTTVYQSTLTQRTTETDENDSTNENDDTTAFGLQRQLDEMEQQWKLEETPISDLTQAVHRFHSNIRLVQAEIDHQAADIAALQSEIVKLKSEKKQLRQVGKKLLKRNEKLYDNLKQTKLENKALARHVKNYIQQVRDKETQQQELIELNNVYKIQAHEQILHQTYNTRGHRMRLESNDSTISAGDGLNSSDAALLSCAMAQGDDDCHSVQSTSVSSFSSFVTDDGIATVKFVPQSPLRDSSFGSLDYGLEPHHVQSIKRKQAAQLPPTYTLSFAKGTKLGLKIRNVPITDTFVPKAPSSPRPSSSRGLLDSAVGADDGEDGPMVLTPILDEEHQNGFTSGLRSFLTTNKAQSVSKLDSHSVGSDPTSKPLIEPHAFLVCGYTDYFDSKTNKKPPMGARVVAVNGKAVCEEWTMSEFMDNLKRGVNESETYSVTFRNEPLSKRQQELLDMPANEFHAMKTNGNVIPSSPKSTSALHDESKPSSFNLNGLLNFNNSTTDNKQAAPKPASTTEAKDDSEEESSHPVSALLRSWHKK